MSRSDSSSQGINPTLAEMMWGIALWSLLLCLAFVWFVDSRISFVLSIAAGALAAAGMAFHMYRSIEDSLDLSQDDAVKHMRRGTLLRTLAMMAMFVLIWRLHGSVVGVFLGMLTLKLCAYTQPLIHRVRKKFHP